MTAHNIFHQKLGIIDGEIQKCCILIHKKEFVITSIVKLCTLNKSFQSETNSNCRLCYMSESFSYQQWNSRTFSWLFPAKVPIFTDFLQHENMIFWPSQEFTRVTQMQNKLLQRPFAKNKYDFSFYVLYQLNHDKIYKMSNTMEIWFPIFLTLTVKIWNEAFILISAPFFLTFSWLFGEFQNFLTHQNFLTFSWLFKF